MAKIYITGIVQIVFDNEVRFQFAIVSIHAFSKENTYTFLKRFPYHRLGLVSVQKQPLLSYTDRQSLRILTLELSMNTYPFFAEACGCLLLLCRNVQS